MAKLAERTPMPHAASSSKRALLAGAMVCGMLLALAMHVMGQRLGIDLGVLWRSDLGHLIPASAALAWWLVALAAFVGGYVTARLMNGAASGQIPPRMRQFLIAIVVVVLAAAGQAAAAPSAVPTIASVVNGLIVLCLGGAMAFCGAYFALRRI